VYEVTAHFSCTGCTPDTSGNLTGTEWWVWHIYYNSEQTGGMAEENSVYQIHNVRENSMGTHKVRYDQVNLDDSTPLCAAMPNCSSCVKNTGLCRVAHFHDPPAYPNWQWTGVIMDYSLDDSAGGTEPPRERILYTGYTGVTVPALVHRETHDVSMGCKHNDSTQWTDSEQLPRQFSTTFGMGDGDIPSDCIYSYQHASFPAMTGDRPADDDGYPYQVSDSWKQWVWSYDDGRFIVPGNIMTEKGFKWNVPQFIQDYDVAANCEAADVTTQTFDVYDVTRKNTFWEVYPATGATPNGRNWSADADTTHFYWSDSVKNYVRLLDVDTYAGREDWGIKAWESRRTDVTVNDFSDSGTGFNINVTVENNCQTCQTGNFSVLALIMDMDAVTPDDSVPYINGKTVFPDVSAGWSSTNGISTAIQHTGTLAYGQSATLTWSNVGSSSTTHEYKLWCNGGTATIN
jgi:hypothetical protein